jgi:ribosome-associated protein
METGDGPRKSLIAEGIRVGKRTLIPMREIELRTSRSGGPGGQHVNKVETQVQVRWDLEDSEAVSEAQKRRIRAALGHRLAGGRYLTTRSRAKRSQTANRRAALERLAELLTRALEPRKRRRPTRPTTASRETRLRTKRRQSQRKRERTRPTRDD